MPFTVANFNYLYDCYNAAENETRLFYPEFQGGWFTVNMQLFHTTHTIDRLLTVQHILQANSNVLAGEIKALREANPERKTRDNRRITRVARSAGVKVAIPNNPETRMAINSRLSKAESNEDGKAQVRAAKIQFERDDYKLRHKLAGLKLLQDLATDGIKLLSNRKHRYDRLHTTAVRWQRRVYEEADIEHVKNAQENVTEGSREVKEICAMLDVLEKTFIDGTGLRLPSQDSNPEEMEMDTETDAEMGMESEMRHDEGAGWPMLTT